MSHLQANLNLLPNMLKAQYVGLEAKAKSSLEGWGYSLIYVH